MPDPHLPPVPAAPGPSGATLVVAVDGPSGAGKSTVAREVARRLGLRYLDTGAMYRAATWAVLERGVDTADVAAVAKAVVGVQLQIGTDPDRPTTAVDGTDVGGPIRSGRVTAAVSAVSAVPAVRAALVDQQRELIGAGGIVVEGRDIGTTVAPGAAVKVFLTADPEVRARRRAAELDGDDAGSTQQDLARRDAHDSSRAASPMTRALDAAIIDATDLTVEQVVDVVLDLVRRSQASADRA